LSSACGVGVSVGAVGRGRGVGAQQLRIAGVPGPEVQEGTGVELVAGVDWVSCLSKACTYCSVGGGRGWSGCWLAYEYEWRGPDILV
jgi:hypothetical protein